MKVGIIGAGIGGIATAVRLAARGHTVEVFEANAQAGGKLSQFDLGDFRFDAGPSLFTMPQYVEELFAVAGENAADYFTYERIPIVCHYFWNDKQTLLAHADPSDFSDLIFIAHCRFGCACLRGFVTFTLVQDKPYSVFCVTLSIANNGSVHGDKPQVGCEMAVRPD